MQEEKKWFQSRTVWGGLVVIAATIAGVFGYTVNETMQAQVIDYIMAGITAVGGLVAIYGRVKADKVIK